jgi:hypothetical protein
LKALISGQAGVAVILEGAHAISIRVGQSEFIALEPNGWSHLFADSNDVLELHDVSREEVMRELSLASTKDQALHLLLILLDVESLPDSVRASAECLEKMVSDESVSRFLEYRLSQLSNFIFNTR